LIDDFFIEDVLTKLERFPEPFEIASMMRPDLFFCV
jgi:hypothetical protein